jgi:hypothetical protein
MGWLHKMRAGMASVATFSFQILHKMRVGMASVAMFSYQMLHTQQELVGHKWGTEGTTCI